MPTSEEENHAEHQSLLGRHIPPRGSKIVYFGFMLLGLGTLLPWNFIITADSYWQYKLRNVTNGNWTPSDDGSTYLQELYAPMLVCLSQITTFVFLFVNAIFSHLIHHRKRMSWSIILLIIFFSGTTAMVKICSDSWQTLFFVLTMIIIVAMAASGAVFQGGLVGLAGMFPESHMCAVFGGQSLGGVFAALSRIISLFFGADPVSSAFIYFFIAVALLIITFSVYLYISKTAYFRHYAEVTVVNDDQEKSNRIVMLTSNVEIFKQIWPLALTVAFVFLITLALFPVMCIRIISSSSNITWKDKYFQPVITFLVFNIGDYFGRQFAGWLMLPNRGSKMIYVLAIARVVFIPLFLFCNHQHNSIPVFFESDAYYVIIMLAFAISNGYLATLSLMYAPRMVAEENAEKAGGIMAAMLGLGLLLGAALSFAFALI